MTPIYKPAHDHTFPNFDGSVILLILLDQICNVRYYLVLCEAKQSSVLT